MDTLSKPFYFTGEPSAAEDATKWLSVIEGNLEPSMTNRKKVDIFSSWLLRASPARKWFNKLPDEVRRRWCLVREAFQSTWCVTTDSPVLIATVLPTSPPSTAFDFKTFGELLSLDDILQFCDAAAAASTNEGRNLKLLWDLAFEQGLSRGLTLRDEANHREKADSVKEAKEAASRAEIDLCLATEKGRTDERSEWTSAGHGPHCISSTAVLSDKIIQTDSVPLIATMCDASVQSPDPLPLAVAPQMTTLPPFNWAEDTASLPIQVVPRRLPPRDFSALRSSKPNPFSSLRRRSNRFNYYSYQSRHRHSHSNFNSFRSPHHISFNTSEPHSHPKTHSHLDWESDPHLSDLSRSLRALGWIRAH
jgi:hypothetical protein